jgi:RNA polymerase sigma factor (sigma-70 family)
MSADSIAPSRQKRRLKQSFEALKWDPDRGPVLREEIVSQEAGAEHADAEFAPETPGGKILDQAAAGALYETHAVKLTRTLAQIFPDWASNVDDAVADVFAHILKRCSAGGTFRIDKDEWQWLMRAGRRRMVFLGKREAARSAGQLDSSYDPIDPGQRQPGSIVLGEEALRKAQASFAALSNLERQIVKLKDEEGLDLRDVASQMGVSYESARKSYQRAKATLEAYRGQYSSTFITPAGKGMHKPGSRKAALEEIGLLPKEASDVLQARYVQGEGDREAARRLDLSVEAYLRRLRHAEELLLIKCGLTCPGELVAALSTSGNGQPT